MKIILILIVFLFSFAAFESFCQVKTDEMLALKIDYVIQKAIDEKAFPTTGLRAYQGVHVIGPLVKEINADEFPFAAHKQIIGLLTAFKIRLNGQTIACGFGVAHKIPVQTV